MLKKIVTKKWSYIATIFLCLTMSMQFLSVYAENRVVDGIFNVASNVTTQNPYSGETFDLMLYINSSSLSEVEHIKGMKVDFDIPSSVKVVNTPVSNSLYTVTKSDTHITIKYLQDVPFGSLKSLKFTLYIQEGVSTPTNTSFEGSFTVSADNVNSVTVKSPVVKPKNIDVPKIMTVVPEFIDPTLIHTAKIKLQTEKFVGGLNHTQSMVRIDMPGDIQIYEIKYGNQVLTAKQNGDGSYYIEIPITTFNVATGISDISVTYSYPPLASGDPITYEIKATYTAKRYNGEDVKEEEKITETVTVGNSGARRNLLKIGQNSVMKIKGEGLSFALTFIPGEDLKNVSFTDDPVRGGEADFFDAARYQSIIWSAASSFDENIDKKVKTQLLYETALNPGVWVAYGGPTESNSVSIASLGLASNDYVTRIKFNFYNGDGKETIAKNSGKVSIKLFLSTTQAITSSDTSKSYVSDNFLTNSAYITGEYKVNGVYQTIVDDGVENKQYADVKVEPAQTLVGYERWENYNAFHKNPIEVGENFIYTARPVVFNLDIADAVMYIGINDPYVDIKKVTIRDRLGDYSYENATYEIVKTKNGYTIKVQFHNTVPVSGWGNSAWVQVEGIAKPGVKADVAFRSVMTSQNDAHPFQYPITINFEGFGMVKAGGNAATSYLSVTKSLAMNTLIQASEDDTDYKLTKTITGTNGIANGIYKIRLENPQTSTSQYDKSVFIVSLPQLNDSLAMSSAQKNSTVAPQIQKITSDDGTPFSAAGIELYYSTDATPENNKKELVNFSDVHSTWTSWDGQTPLPKQATHIKIVNSNTLAPGEQMTAKLHAKFEDVGEDVRVAWASVATGAIMNGSYTMPGEPTKSGIYVSSLTADKELGGVLWEDANADGIKNTTETKIAGVEVHLYDWNNDFVATAITDANGQYHFDNLFAKKYSVEFEKVMTQHLTTSNIGTDKSVDSDFEEYGEATAKVMANVNLATETHPLNVDAGLYKYASIGNYVWFDADSNGQQDAYEDGIADVLLNLYRVEADGSLTFVSTTTTNEQGFYMFKDLMPGSYKVQASEVEGYQNTHQRANGVDVSKASVLGSDYQTPTILITSGTSNEDVDLGYRMVPYGTITITKQGDQSQVLSGAKYGIWKTGESTSSTPFDIQTTNNEGQLSFTQLPVGDYQIKELEAPVGYDLDNTVHTESITESLLHVNVIYHNALSKATLSIHKTDTQGNPLAGAEFTLYKETVSDATKVKSLITDHDGHLEFDQLDQGIYKLVETKAPTGYVLDETIYDVVFDRTTLQKTLTIQNVAMTGKIIINKIDEDKKPLEGAVFGLYKKGDDLTRTPLEVLTSNAEGQLVFDHLEQAQYVVKEMTAPVGYTLSTDLYEATLIGNDLEVFIEVVNKKMEEGVPPVITPITPPTIPDSKPVTNDAAPLMVLTLMALVSGYVLHKNKKSANREE